MIKQVLEVLFASFVRKTRMLLHDQLSDGVNVDMDVDGMTLRVCQRPMLVLRATLECWIV